jgi:hypothetical protein
METMENDKMKNERETRSGTAKNQNREQNTIISAQNGISVSETAKAMLREMDKNTPSNELILRGWS